MKRKSEKGKVKREKSQDTRFIQGLIFICLLGILVLAFLWDVRVKQVAQRDTQRKADLMTVQEKIEEYYEQNKKFPQEFDFPKDPHKQLYYSYRVSKDGTKYELFARLENSKDTDVTGTDTDCGARCNFVITNK
ncbi:MAG: hypothetical protein AAB599_01060 [Patescibacteria group bacterium]